MEEWYEVDMHIHFGQAVVNMHLLQYSSGPPVVLLLLLLVLVLVLVLLNTSAIFQQ